MLESRKCLIGAQLWLKWRRGHPEEELRGSLGDVYISLLGVTLTQCDTTPRIKSRGLKALAMGSAMEEAVERISESSVCFSGT